jgi:GxxExxY protein
MPIRRLGGLIEQERTESIIGGFYEVYSTFGFGFSESVYAAALEKELRLRGHKVAREVLIRVYYKGEVIARQRMDMLVDDVVVVENKTSRSLVPRGGRQLYNYLRASKLEVGLLLHYGPKPKFLRLFAPNA